MNNKPIISVIIPCFNYANFLVAAIKSVLNQSFKKYEIIVVNDASRDNTDLIVTKFMKNNKNIRLISLEKNVGLAKARNIGIRKSYGKYIFPLDADNKIQKDCLKEMYSIIKKEEYGIIHSKIKYFGKSNKIMTSCHKYNASRFRMQNSIDAMALFRKKDWMNVGGYKNIKVGWEDYEFWINMIRHGIKPYFINKVLCYYRLHENNMINNTLKNIEIALNGIYKYHGDWCVEVPKYFKIATEYISGKCYRKAKFFLNKILKIDPHNYYASYNLGSIYKTEKKFEKAIKCYLNAKDNSWGYTEDYSGIYFHIGSIYECLGNRNKAKFYLEKSLKYNKQFKSSKLLLKKINEK